MYSNDRLDKKALLVRPFGKSTRLSFVDHEHVNLILSFLTREGIARMHELKNYA